MEFTDRLLTCVECSKEFIFTAGEQLFFHDKQFKNDPKRCKPCKSKRSGGVVAKQAGGPAAAGISRTETRTHCSECNVETTVPFRPTQGRPVLCRACFQGKRGSAAVSQTAGAEAVADMPLGMLAGQAMHTGMNAGMDAAMMSAPSAEPAISEPGEAIAGAASLQMEPIADATPAQTDQAVSEPPSL